MTLHLFVPVKCSIKPMISLVRAIGWIFWNVLFISDFSGLHWHCFYLPAPITSTCSHSAIWLRRLVFAMSVLILIWNRSVQFWIGGNYWWFSIYLSFWWRVFWEFSSNWMRPVIYWHRFKQYIEIYCRPRWGRLFSVFQADVFQFFFWGNIFTIFGAIYFQYFLRKHRFYPILSLFFSKSTLVLHTIVFVLPYQYFKTEYSEAMIFAMWLMKVKLPVFWIPSKEKNISPKLSVLFDKTSKFVWFLFEGARNW